MDAYYQRISYVFNNDSKIEKLVRGVETLHSFRLNTQLVRSFNEISPPKDKQKIELSSINIPMHPLNTHPQDK